MKIEIDERLKKWEDSDNYLGPDYSEHYIIYSHSRDSDIYIESNWDTMQDIFKDFMGVEVIGFGHWACGWIEALMIHESDIDKAFMDIFIETMDKLEDYPILNEADYSQKEYDRALELIDCYSNLTNDYIPDDWKEMVYSEMYDMDSYIENDYHNEEDLKEVLKSLGFYDYEGQGEDIPEDPLPKPWVLAKYDKHQKNLSEF